MAQPINFWAGLGQQAASFDSSSSFNSLNESLKNSFTFSNAANQSLQQAFNNITSEPIYDDKGNILGYKPGGILGRLKEFADKEVQKQITNERNKLEQEALNKNKTSIDSKQQELNNLFAKGKEDYFNQYGEQLEKQISANAIKQAETQARDEVYKQAIEQTARQNTNDMLGADEYPQYLDNVRKQVTNITPDQLKYYFQNASQIDFDSVLSPSDKEEIKKLLRNPTLQNWYNQTMQLEVQMKKQEAGVLTPEQNAMIASKIREYAPNYYNKEKQTVQDLLTERINKDTSRLQQIFGVENYTDVGILDSLRKQSNLKHGNRSLPLEGEALTKFLLGKEELKLKYGLSEQEATEQAMQNIQQDNSSNIFATNGNSNNTPISSDNTNDIPKGVIHTNKSPEELERINQDNYWRNLKQNTIHSNFDQKRTKILEENGYKPAHIVTKVGQKAYSTLVGDYNEKMWINTLPEDIQQSLYPDEPGFGSTMFDLGMGTLMVATGSPIAAPAVVGTTKAVVGTAKGTAKAISKGIGKGVDKVKNKFIKQVKARDSKYFQKGDDVVTGQNGQEFIKREIPETTIQSEKLLGPDGKSPLRITTPKRTVYIDPKRGTYVDEKIALGIAEEAAKRVGIGARLLQQGKDFLSYLNPKNIKNIKDIKIPGIRKIMDNKMASIAVAGSVGNAVMNFFTNTEHLSDFDKNTIFGLMNNYSIEELEKMNMQYRTKSQLDINNNTDNMVNRTQLEKGMRLTKTAIELLELQQEEAIELMKIEQSKNELTVDDIREMQVYFSDKNKDTIAKDYYRINGIEPAKIGTQKYEKELTDLKEYMKIGKEFADHSLDQLITGMTNNHPNMIAAHNSEIASIESIIRNAPPNAEGKGGPTIFGVSAPDRASQLVGMTLLLNIPDTAENRPSMKEIMEKLNNNPDLKRQINIMMGSHEGLDKASKSELVDDLNDIFSPYLNRSDGGKIIVNKDNISTGNNSPGEVFYTGIMSLIKSLRPNKNNQFPAIDKYILAEAFIEARKKIARKEITE